MLPCSCDHFAVIRADATGLQRLEEGMNREETSATDALLRSAVRVCRVFRLPISIG